MGTIIPPPPIIPPVPPGNHCSHCWGVGKHFGDIPTPSKIYVNIEGVEKGPLWNSYDGEPFSGTFELEQNPIWPCRYATIDPVWPSLRCEFGTRDILMIASNFERNSIFLGWVPQACQGVAGNWYRDSFKNGQMTLLPPV